MVDQDAKAVAKEKRFFDALRDVFVGAKIEGESGFINLMAIKSRYYEKGVFPKLKEDIDEALEPFPDFRAELFDKLYTFFHRYFSESGSIYFRHTAFQQNVYEKVYTDDKDVMLFWKTHMLYYVKTDRLFNSLGIEVDGQKFFFDVSTLQHKKANEKRTLVYDFKERRGDGTLVFTVTYSERGRKTKIADILRVLKRKSVTINEATLQRAFRVFEKQSEVDYFINKNAKVFLEEQFKLWVYQYMFSGISEWTETRIKQLQVLKEIAFKIIAFVSQFEDELVKIWNKPKFVLNSNYVITLDRIAEKSIPLVEKILSHKSIKAQIAEWQELGIVDNSFKLSAVFTDGPSGKRLSKQYMYLPIDTKFFKDLELDVLSLFDNLDHALDGWVVKSENYQALKMLTHKFKETFQCIYIDPPYNSPSSEIIYENNFKSSTWLTSIANRLQLSTEVLKKDGILCIAIDDNEFEKLTHVIGSSFVERLGVAVVRSNPAGRSSPKGFSVAHEYAVFAAKGESASIGRLARTEEQIKRYKETNANGRKFEWVNFRKHGGQRAEDPKMFYPIYLNEAKLKIRIPRMEWNAETSEWSVIEKPKKTERVLLPIDENGQERRWKWAKKTLENNLSAIKVDYNRNGQLTVYIPSEMGEEGIIPLTWWDKKEYSATDHGTRVLKSLFGELGVFSYPKSPYLVEDCLRVARVDQREAVIDFYAGSGTTAHAIINMNREDGRSRKYFLVEMAEYYGTVVLPRIKKAVFCEQWKDGQAFGGEGIGHFMKYYCLEQYEDTLRKVNYQDTSLFEDPNKDLYNQYIFLRDLKMLGVLAVDPDKNKVKVDLSKLYDNIDIPETLSNLTGKWIKRITAKSVIFEDGEEIDIENLDWKLIKPLIWW